MSTNSTTGTGGHATVSFVTVVVLVAVEMDVVMVLVFVVVVVVVLAVMLTKVSLMLVVVRVLDVKVVVDLVSVIDVDVKVVVVVVVAVGTLTIGMMPAIDVAIEGMSTCGHLSTKPPRTKSASATPARGPTVTTLFTTKSTHFVHRRQDRRQPVSGGRGKSSSGETRLSLLNRDHAHMKMTVYTPARSQNPSQS
mmetsp:Transcript_50802/g.134233  ORF Transcript_50802/g.134233 Transcript_50802/m.134233 type:complete len:194 (-) Transcript_50802:562-1143(-)